MGGSSLWQLKDWQEMIGVPYFQTRANVWKDEVCEVPALEVASSHSKKHKAQLGQPDLEWVGADITRNSNGTWRVPFGNFLSPSGTFGIHHVIIGILSHYSNPHGLYRRSSRTNPQVPSAQTDLLLHRPSPTLVSPADASPSETATCWR